MRSDVESQLRALGLLGLASHLGDLGDAPWLETIIRIEREERTLRGLDRRMKNARLGTSSPTRIMTGFGRRRSIDTQSNA